MEIAPKSKKIAKGIVVEALPDTLFRVELDETKEILLAYLSGRMKLNRIRIMIGDKVDIELDPYGGKGRIVRRF